MTISIKKLFNIYSKQHLELNARTYRRRYGDFVRYWVGHIDELTLKKLTTNIVAEWMTSIANKHGKSTANNQLKMLRAMLRWSVKRELIPKASVFEGIDYYQTNKSINYLLPEQVTVFKKALDDAPKDIHDAIWLMLLTGQRKSNVVSMQWKEIDFNSCIWNIPASKTKSARQYSIPLTGRAMDILKSRFRDRAEWISKIEPSEWVFTSPYSGNYSYKSIKYIDKAWYKIRELAGLPNLRIHDLRHTAATWMALEGASASQIQRALNHSSIVTSQRYIHLAAKDIGEAMNKSQERLLS